MIDAERAAEAGATMPFLAPESHEKADGEENPMSSTPEPLSQPQNHGTDAPLADELDPLGPGPGSYPDPCADVVTRADYRLARGASPLEPGEPDAVEAVRRVRDRDPLGLDAIVGGCPDPAAHQRRTLSEEEATALLDGVIQHYRELTRWSIHGPDCQASAIAWGVQQLRERGVIL